MCQRKRNFSCYYYNVVVCFCSPFIFQSLLFFMITLKMLNCWHLFILCKITKCGVNYFQDNFLNVSLLFSHVLIQSRCKMTKESLHCLSLPTLTKATFLFDFIVTDKTFSTQCNSTNSREMLRCNVAGKLDSCF